MCKSGDKIAVEMDGFIESEHNRVISPVRTDNNCQWWEQHTCQIYSRQEWVSEQVGCNVPLNS